VIEIRNVWKQFGKQQVLKGISLSIKEGKTTAIVGPSGAGKSVCIKIIMGIMMPDAGDVFICGRDISKIKRESKKNEIRKDLGVLFQSAALFDSLNVYENVLFPLIERGRCSSRKESHNKVIDILESLSLCEYTFNFPESLSIGTRKRVGLARALVTEPKVLLIDEPNTGLDPLVGQEVYDLIKECQAKWRFTAVVISHEIPEVFQVSDRVAMLLNGHIVDEGTPEEIKASSNEAVQQFINGKVEGPIKIK
jgi:phospholipid/cholesterol/gamma-HCH transport system ATP-binding protein